MCMEALYRRLDGKKYHGAYWFFFKVIAEAVESLKDMCEDRGAWKRNVGARTIEGILEVIRSLKKGIPTVYDNISLRLKSYVTFEAGELSPLEVTSMIEKKGPVIGGLYVDGQAYFRSTVYRGDRAFPANHAVVCTGYRYIDGELFIKIMDNVEPGGPFRFVLHEAFQEFHVLTVDAC